MVGLISILSSKSVFGFGVTDKVALSYRVLTLYIESKKYNGDISLYRKY